MLPTLPAPRQIVTTHEEGKSTVQQEQDRPVQFEVRFVHFWGELSHPESSVVSVLPKLDNQSLCWRDLSVDGAERKIAGPGLGVVHEGGVSCRYSDLAPGAIVPMHRTTSTDVIVLIAGQILLILEDGSATPLVAGDSVVQRGTMNPSTTEWARLMAVVVDAKPVIVDGAELKNEMRER